MKQITEDYVSYEIAQLLKEKGFKQDCDYATSWYAAEYYKNSAQGEWFEGEHEIIKDIDDKCTISYLSDKGVFIPAPTQSLALKWLREVHNQIIIIKYGNVGFAEESILQWWWELLNTKGELHACNIVDGNKSYEEACEDSILYVLKNLI